MYQSDRGNYRTKDSFTSSCLGKLIILAGVLIVLLVIAYLTVPTEQTMQDEMTDNIMQCIEANSGNKSDGLDDFINNIGFTFTSADSVVDREVWANYEEYNHLEHYHHTFFATTYIFNNLNSEGVRCGIGIFGLVIPTIKYSEIILQTGPMHKGYNKPIMNETIPDNYFGETPQIKEYHYKNDPNN